jgi:hypothetical protein
VAGKPLNSRFVGCKEAAWPRSGKSERIARCQHA